MLCEMRAKNKEGEKELIGSNNRAREDVVNISLTLGELVLGNREEAPKDQRIRIAYVTDMGLKDSNSYEASR